MPTISDYTESLPPQPGHAIRYRNPQFFSEPTSSDYVYTTNPKIRQAYKEIGTPMFQPKHKGVVVNAEEESAPKETASEPENSPATKTDEETSGDTVNAEAQAEEEQGSDEEAEVIDTNDLNVSGSIAVESNDSGQDHLPGHDGYQKPWKEMDWPELRSYAASITDKPIRNKADAVKAVQEHEAEITVGTNSPG